MKVLLVLVLIGLVQAFHWRPGLNWFSKDKGNVGTVCGYKSTDGYEYDFDSLVVVGGGNTDRYLYGLIGTEGNQQKIYIDPCGYAEVGCAVTSPCCGAYVFSGNYFSCGVKPTQQWQDFRSPLTNQTATSQGAILSYSDGSPCVYYDPTSPKRSINIYLQCDPASTKAVVVRTTTLNDCQYEMVVNTTTACGSKPQPHRTDHKVMITLIVVGVCTLVAVLVIAVCICQKKRFENTGYMVINTVP